MNLVSMRTEDSGGVSEAKPNPYGYGLCIALTEEQVEALGLKDSPPAAGSVASVQASAVVVAVNQEADPDGDGDGIDVCLRLQITDMAVSLEGMTMQKAASVLYGQ